GGGRKARPRRRGLALRARRLALGGGDGACGARRARRRRGRSARAMVILPMGERALLVELGTLDEVLALHRRLEASTPAGVAELVPAARTVLVVVDPKTLPLSAARAWIERATGAAGTRDAEGPLVEMEITYDGPDLTSTAELFGIGPGELVRRHLAAPWRVAFTGFAPGFGYLVSDAWDFDVPRLDAPRTRVPSGAVGLAAGFTGAYP